MEKITTICKAVLLFGPAILSISSFAQKKMEPGRIFRDCPECPDMVVIPGGTFTMGSPESETGRNEIENSQKKISLRSFTAGKYPITVGQWSAFVKETNRPTTRGCSWSALKDTTRKPWENNPDASWQHLGFSQDDNHPVVCVSWYDTQDYVQWLSKKTGHNYRLLTEAEWEYAARAGTNTAYYWGSVPSHEYANYGADSGYVGIAAGRDQWQYTSPVGSFPPNAFGLYDMLGNVWQYVEGCFTPSITELPADGSAYKADIVLNNMTGRLSRMNGTKSCERRMLRGGCFGDPPRLIRAGFRNSTPAPGTTLENCRTAGVGFRVARD
jgi:formylglycine-generating enzyme required for sulfatase activity